METIKSYTGDDVALANACRDLEIFIGNVDGAELDDGVLVVDDTVVRAFNLIIDRLNG